VTPLQINKPKTPKQNKYVSPPYPPKPKKTQKKAAYKTITLKKRMLISIEKPQDSRQEKS
jgi:hypothetical protein